MVLGELEPKGFGGYQLSCSQGAADLLTRKNEVLGRGGRQRSEKDKLLIIDRVRVSLT